VITVLAPLKLPPFISASQWSTLYNALAEAVAQKRGRITTVYSDDKGRRIAVPRVTNGEMITILAAFQPPLYGIRQAAFPLWDQLAAAAYGWNPSTGKLNTSDAFRDALVPDVLLTAFWMNLEMACSALEATQQRARIDFDGRWDDIVFQNIVKHAVENDGTITNAQTAHAAFGIPLPACKGPDGKPRAPKCKRGMKRWPYLCEEWEKCEPLIVKDPITVVRDKAANGFQMLLLIGAIWFVLDNRKPRRRARRYQ
jgi:hypothetical protein